MTMKLHTDQTPEALKAVCPANGFCGFCGDVGFGWWQGVVVDQEDAPGHPVFFCGICACILDLVPPPLGYMKLMVHEEVLREWKIPGAEKNGGYNQTQLTASCQDAMPLLIAWMLEMFELPENRLKQRVICFENNSLKKGLWPMVMRRPIWLPEDSGLLDAANYAYSAEDLAIHAAIRGAIEAPTWTRTALCEFGNYWAPLDVNAFIGRLPPGHPAHQEGFHWASVLNWGSLIGYGAKTVDGIDIIPEVHGEPVDKAVRAIVSARVVSPETPLWKALGLA